MLSVGAATALLLVVAGGAAAPRVNLGASSGGAQLLLDLATALVVVGSVTGLVLLIGSFRARKSTPVHVERKRGAVASLIVLMAVLALIRFLPDPTSRGTQGPTVGQPGVTVEEDDGAVAIEPDRPLVLTALLTAAVLAGMAALARRELDRRTTWPQGAPDDPELEHVREAVLRARADLEAIHDPREAILRSYERLRVDLRDVGVAPRVDDTPRQVVRRALTVGGIPAQAVDDLVSVFEEARFSTHGIGPPHRERALAALAAVEQSLGVRSTTTGAP